ncbi:MAG: C40 family peptidase [Candidatus Nanopelagicaceae bacterium]
MISLSVKQAIAGEARKASPNECCGFVVDGRVVPCENVHPSPLENFAIAAEDYVRVCARGEIEAVYHSHVEGVKGFSVPDVKACKQSNLPWIVFHAGTGDFYYADPSGKAPYEGRQWVYGIHDCYAILRDFYSREFAIELDDFERGEENEWESKSWTMFVDNYKDQGFYEIEKPECKGDFLLMQIGAPSPNHAGVISGNGNLFYHHLMGRLSERSVYGGYWAKVTAKVLRHKDVKP